MKNFKKIAFGLMVGAMAIGFSAFTNAKPEHKKGVLTDYTFVHPLANNNQSKTQFIYDPTPGTCTTSSNVCTAVWRQADEPGEGDNPESDATLQSHINGTYVGN